jgi:arylsulfatase A-like enzyme
VCMVIRFPKAHEKLQNGALLRAFSTVADITPTILELAGIKHPVPAGQAKGTWHGKQVAGMRGKSWVKYFAEGKDGMEMIHTNDDPAYGWELFGRAGK